MRHQISSAKNFIFVVNLNVRGICCKLSLIYLSEIHFSNILLSTPTTSKLSQQQNTHSVWPCTGIDTSSHSTVQSTLSPCTFNTEPVLAKQLGGYREGHTLLL